MPTKRPTPEAIVAKLRQVDVLTAQGPTIATAAEAIGVTATTDHRRRHEFGGPKLDQVRRLKELEAANTRLRKAVSDLTRDELIPREAMQGTSSAPPGAARRSIAPARCSASRSAGPVRPSASPARPRVAGPGRLTTSRGARLISWS